MEICGYICTDHVLEMMEEREITKEQVEEMIKHGIPKNNKYDGKFEINYDDHRLVFDQVTKTLVTVFFRNRPLRGNERREVPTEEQKLKVPYKRVKFIYKPETGETRPMKTKLTNFLSKNPTNIKFGSGREIYSVLKKTEEKINVSMRLGDYLDAMIKDIGVYNPLNRFATRGSSENKVKNLFNPDSMMVEAIGTITVRDVSSRLYIDIPGTGRLNLSNSDFILLDGHSRTKRLVDLYKKGEISPELLDYNIDIVAHICDDHKAEKLFRRLNNGAPVNRSDNSLSPGGPLGRLIAELELLPTQTRETKQLNALEGLVYRMNGDEEAGFSSDPSLVYEDLLSYGNRFNDLQKKEANEYLLDLTEEQKEFLQDVQLFTNEVIDFSLDFVEEEHKTIQKLVLDSVKNAGFNKLIQCIAITKFSNHGQFSKVKSETIAARFVSNITESVRKNIGQLNNQTRRNREKAFKKVIQSFNK